MRRIALIVGVLFLAWTLFTSVTFVQPGERAVVRRFGRVLDEMPKAGLFIGLPWGLDRVDRVPVGKVRHVLAGQPVKFEEDDSGVPAGQLLTGNHNLVDVQIKVFFTVREEKVVQFVLQQQDAEDLVVRAADAVLAEWIAARTVDEVLLHGKTALPQHLAVKVQERLDAYDLGVRIEQTTITRLQPPDEVKDAFEQVAQAQTAISTQMYQAEQAAASKLRETEAEIFRIQRQTASYAEEQRLQAQAEAEVFTKRLDEYRKLVARDPDYINTLWRDEMTRLYARMRESGRIDVLDHYLSSEGINITQFPLLPKKK